MACSRVNFYLYLYLYHLPTSVDFYWLISSPQKALGKTLPQYEAMSA